MKRFFKLNVFALAALLFLGVADAWGLGINRNVPLNFEVEGGNGSWNQNSKTMTWTASTWNLLKFTDWSNSDLSGYDKMTINVSSTSNKNRAQYRVLITIDGANYTCKLTGSGTKTINIKSDFKNGNATIQSISGDPLKKVESIRIGGDSNSGNITISSISFHKTVEWNSNGRITFYATDFNIGTNVTAESNKFTFSKADASISLDFDGELSAKDIAYIEQNIVGVGNTHQVYKGNYVVTKTNNWGQKYTENVNASLNNLGEARNRSLKMNSFQICANSNNTNITFNSVTFTKMNYVSGITSDDLLYFENFEGFDNNTFLSESEAPAVNQRPTEAQQGKYFLYGGRGKILKDPTFNSYYQNIADANEFTKSLSQNFLRYVFTDDQRSANETAIKNSGAATIGFWVNGQLAVDYELPLERGSMFCIFSNDCFAKADAGKIKEKDRPRFMFDISCNGWVYSYMPNTNDNGVDIGNNYFFYGEKYANSGVQSPLESLFGKDNYAHTLDQSQHKFYDDKKWHYVTYVMDKQLTRVRIYLDGKLTGTVEDVTKLPKTNHSECEFSGNNDYKGRTLYLRNIVLGGLTPHGLFYDQQYYSDAALAYDDIAMYGKALTEDQIKAIINEKQYTPLEWHYADSFDEYNESKGGHEIKNNTSGLGITNPAFDASGLLKINKGQTITIPNVPKNYYVRVEYASKVPNVATSTDKNFVLVGRREETVKGKKYYVVAFKANETGTYTLNISSNITVRSIVITPYQFAELKYGTWGNPEHTSFTRLDKDTRYVDKRVVFNVKRTNKVNNYYSVSGEDLGSNPALPELSLLIDGKTNGTYKLYEDINDYKDGVNYPYVKYTSTAPHVAHIDKEGNITMTGIAGNTTIIAELVSDNLYVGSEVVDSFDICIKKEENTLRLAKGQEVLVNSQYPAVNSNKNLNNITLTVGGWSNTPTYNVPGVGEVSDSWKNAETFMGPVKGNEEILDEFNHYSRGTNVAKSESLGNDDGDFYPKNEFANNITPWTLPCRGAYVKFEPVKPGIATIYLLQDGNLDGMKDKDGNSTHVYWRPVYITDETGKVVDFVQTATNGRITLHDNFFVGDKRRAQFIESIAATYNDDPTLRQDLLNLRDQQHDRFTTLIDNWNNAGWRQKVIPTGDGGYMVMSKAIVRYTFNVHPGKTYYLFSNQSQIAISGFNFEEDRLLDTKTQYYETAPVRDVEEGSTLKFTDVLNAQQPEIPTSDKDITHITYERNFAQGKWASICLPFSMNNRQMREQFGEETAVVLLKHIEEDGKIKLIWHVNQDIIAGYPYFILPKGEVKHDNVSNSTINKITVDTYFNGEVKTETPLISVGSNGKTFNWQGSYNGECYDAANPYVFEGNYKNENIPAGSYAMSTSGNITKLAKATTVKPFRAYLKYMGSNANNAKPLYTSIDWQNDETTSIDDIMFQNGILTESADVYGIDGTVIRHNVQNLSNLSKGVYIVNGKKFVVK